MVEASVRVIDTALGLCASRGSRTIDAGAGSREGVLVVADGMGGHCTGWLGARLAVRILAERLGSAGAEARFVGAAEAIPGDWGWAGAMQSSAAGEFVYGECVAAFGDRTALPRDLPSLFAALDRVLASVPPLHRINSPLVQCIAATVDGARVHGAHVGIGRALLLRAGTDRFESLVDEHYLHVVLDRFDPTAAASDLDRSALPQNIVLNGLGNLGGSKLGIDEFEVELGAGDLLLLSSQRLDLPDEEVARLARAALDDGTPLDELARTIERRSAAAFETVEAHRATDVAFAIAVARPAAG